MQMCIFALLFLLVYNKLCLVNKTIIHSLYKCVRLKASQFEPRHKFRVHYKLNIHKHKYIYVYLQFGFISLFFVLLKRTCIEIRMRDEYQN